MQNLTNEELVERAGDHYNYGKDAGKAEAELTRRLIESNETLRKATEDNNTSTKKYNYVILNLTIAMALLAVLQIFMSAVTAKLSWPWKIGFSIAPIMIIIMVIKDKN